MQHGMARTHTNSYVYAKAEQFLNQHRERGQTRKSIIKISEYYETQRRTLIADIICAESSDPIRQVTLQEGSLKQVDYGYRRVGGKRNNWWEKGVAGYWDAVKRELPPDLRYSSYNESCPIQEQHITAAAREGKGTRREKRNTSRMVLEDK